MVLFTGPGANYYLISHLNLTEKRTGFCTDGIIMQGTLSGFALEKGCWAQDFFLLKVVSAFHFKYIFFSLPQSASRSPKENLTS